MDDVAAEEIKTRLDEALADAEPHVGVAFAPDLIQEFWHRSWITLKDFRALGLPGDIFPPDPLPAYGTHYAFALDSLGRSQFKVGGNRLA